MVSRFGATLLSKIRPERARARSSAMTGALSHRINAPIALAFALLTYWSGALQSVDQNLMDSRFRLLRRPPSQSLVVVSIDHKSIEQLVSWPWPRSFHAQVLDKLFAAGAHAVALDIDFSSSSTPAADAALAEAFERHAGRVILPAFRQDESSGGDQSTISETFPNALFRDRVRLGAVNVRPSADSRVREFPYSETFGQLQIPSLAGALAGTAEKAEGSFNLDYGIEIRDIPQISYSDVLHGNFDRNKVAGKNVLIGATAVELGDHLAVPVYGVLPGPMVQALGYESLVQHRALRRTGAAPSVAAAACVVFLLALIASGWNWRRLLLALGVIWAGLYVSALVIAALLPIDFDVTAPGLAALVFCALGCLGQLEHQARLLLQQRAADLRRRALMHRVLEDSFNGIVVTDADGIVEMANPAAGRLLAVAPDQMVGKSIGSLLPVPRIAPDGDELPVDDPALVPLAPVEIELPRGDGAITLELIVSCSGASPASQQPKAAGVVRTYTFQDVSERRRAEQALRDAMQAAIAANRSKSEFLANMSHELRTPLNAIIGFSELIHGEVFGTLPSPRYIEYADDITSSGKHLLSVINDILDMAKVETGKIELEEGVVDVGETLRYCLRLVQAVPGASDLHFEIDVLPGLPLLRGDPRLIRQMIINVLGNAVKFTPEGGSVRALVTRSARGLVVRIEDTGIGIPEGEIPRLGLPFYQVDSRLARTYEGTGLGLALVKAYLGLHQGQLTIESVFGQGTSVAMLFPAARMLSEPSVAAPNVAEAPAPI